MSEQEVLLRAILFDPADDAPRLIYADWLDDHDQSTRAHFIRVSIAIHRKEPGVDEFDRALRFAGLNLDDMSWAGAALDRGWHEGGLSNAEWDRAFISAINCPIATFLKRAKSIFQTQPILNVFITDRRPDQERGFWGWTTGSANNHLGTPGDVPTNLLAPCLMDPYLRASQQAPFSPNGAFFASPEFALAALSDACVDYGRRLAGLPELSR